MTDISIPSVSGQFVQQVQGIVPGQTATAADAAGQLSSVFLQSMLKEVYRAQGQGNAFSPSSGVFSEMFTQQLIEQMAAEDIFGLKQLLSAQTSPEKIKE